MDLRKRRREGHIVYIFPSDFLGNADTMLLGEPMFANTTPPLGLAVDVFVHAVHKLGTTNRAQPIRMCLTKDQGEGWRSMDYSTQNTSSSSSTLSSADEKIGTFGA